MQNYLKYSLISRRLPYGSCFGVRPVTSPTTNEITASTRNTVNRIRPISADMPAIPLAPNNIATNASTKNAIAARNIK